MFHCMLPKMPIQLWDLLLNKNDTSHFFTNSVPLRVKVFIVIEKEIQSFHCFDSFQSAKKCEMTPFSMTSLHVDLTKAAKCVDIIPPTLLASLSHHRTFLQNTNGDDIWTNLRRFINKFLKVGGIKTLISSTPDLSFKIGI